MSERVPASVLVPVLREWFRTRRRDLPWRRERSAYRVWISEAMLQQTRVATVIPYYERFLERFPDVETLARATEEDVLALWSGLGYYRRARTLRLAAGAIVEQHAGRFPRTRAELLLLPGVGPYTAGAIASLAFDAPEPLVDGNVVRVFARLFALAGAAGEPALTRRAWELAAELVPRAGGAGEWNEALMELGALVCTPREPSCGECPLRSRCRAHALGRAAEFPAAKARKAEVEVELVALLVEREGRWLLRRREPGGRMAGLWELPTRERAAAGAEPRLFPARWPSVRGRALLREGEELRVLRHTITHHRIRLSLASGTLRGAAPAEGWRWASADGAGALALTGMTRKALAARIPERA